MADSRESGLPEFGSVPEREAAIFVGGVSGAAHTPVTSDELHHVISPDGYVGLRGKDLLRFAEMLQPDDMVWIGQQLVAATVHTETSPMPEENMSGSGRMSFCNGGLVVKVFNSEVLVDGEHAPMSATQYRIFEYLAKNYRVARSKVQIYEACWEDGLAFPRPENVRIQIRRVREALGNYSDRLVTRQGYGYTWDAELDPAPQEER